MGKGMAMEEERGGKGENRMTGGGREGREKGRIVNLL